MRMGLEDCTACARRHERPANSKCSYIKAALTKCEALGAPAVDYMLHLPDIDSLPVEGEAGEAIEGGILRALQSSESEFVKLLIHENEESCRLLEVSKVQMDAMIKEMQELMQHYLRREKMAAHRSTPASLATRQWWNVVAQPSQLWLLSCFPKLLRLDFTIHICYLRLTPLSIMRSSLSVHLIGEDLIFNLGFLTWICMEWHLQAEVALPLEEHQRWRPRIGDSRERRYPRLLRVSTRAGGHLIHACHGRRCTQGYKTIGLWASRASGLCLPRRNVSVWFMI